MASPVDTSVKFITSDMVGAPALAGAAGSLVALLDAFLVDGWGQQTASSLVVSEGVATLTLPSAFPAVVNSVILVAGSSIEALNGEQKVTQVLTASNQVRFATDAPNGTASGTITARMAPAGWVKAFSGVNKAAYRSQNPQAHGGGMLLRVDDTGTTLARVVGYEQMSDVDTGIGPFPTAAQISGGGYWAKAGAAGATPRGYAIIADPRTFYPVMFPNWPSAAISTNAGLIRGFGDGIARRPAGDAYAVFLGSSNGTSLTAVTGSLDHGNDANVYCPRNFTGLGTAEAGRSLPYVGAFANASGADATLGAFPSPVDGAMYLTPRYWAASTGIPPRFDFPGMLSVPQSGLGAAFQAFAQVPGGGAYAGRTLLAIPAATTTNSTATGVTFFDITGPWR